MEQKQLLCYLKQAAQGSYCLDPPLPESAKCAVVSSSGAMKLHHHGIDIDRHPVIFRFNDNPASGSFAEWVGHESRQTIRYGWNLRGSSKAIRAFGESVVAHPGTRRTVHHAFGQDVWAFEMQPNWEIGLEAVKTVFQRLYPNWANSIPDGKKRKQVVSHELTTGFNGMIIALANCAQVDAYEMVPSGLATTASYSYYGPTSNSGKATENNYHGYFAAEHDLWAKLTVTNFSQWDQTGKTSFVGFQSVECPKQVPFPGAMEATGRNWA